MTDQQREIQRLARLLTRHQFRLEKQQIAALIARADAILAEHHDWAERDGVFCRVGDRGSEIDRLRTLCAEMYQVAGTLGADARVLDNLSAAASGKPLPHASLLPYPQADPSTR